jgi:hypothetical protein
MSDEFPVEPEEIKTPWLTNKTYDILKYLALVLLPALGTMYFALASIWGLPAAEQVVGTIVVVDTFLGVILRYAARQYESTDAKFDGNIVVTPTETGSLYSLELNGDPEELQGKHEVVFKVTS